MCCVCVGGFSFSFLCAESSLFLPPAPGLTKWWIRPHLSSHTGCPPCSPTCWNPAVDSGGLSVVFLLFLSFSALVSG